MEDATLIKHTKQAFVLRSHTGKEEFLLQGEMLVGREVECAIPLNSGHISRYHAKLNVSPSGVYVEDLHSTNGTFVNGSKIKGRVRLSVGDEVAFDDFVFRLASNDSGAEAATQLTPRKHAYQSIAPSVHQIRPKDAALEASRRDADLDDDINDLELFEKHIKPSVAPSPAVTPSAKNTPKVAPIAEPAPAKDVEAQDTGDRTQMLSSEQINGLLERNRIEQQVNVGTGPRLIVMTAPIRGKVFQLQTSANTHNWQIGRDAHNEICLNDRTISNDHARIARSPGGKYLLTATHAKNGIYVNGALTAKATLEHGDKIQIGRTELVFKTDQEVDEKAERRPNLPPIPENAKMRREGLIVAAVVVTVLALAIIFTGR